VTAVGILLNLMQFAEQHPPQPSLAVTSDDELDELKVQSLLD
jgi:hypothetical protein